MRKSCYLLMILLLIACAGSSKLPKEKFSQTSVGLRHHYEKDTAFFTIQNPLYTPIRVSVSSDKKEIQDIVKNFGNLIISARTDTVVKIFAPEINIPEINYHIDFGDPQRIIKPSPIAFPFSKHKNYKIIQGHNGSFSHSSDYSRYAVDFNMKVGDTILSVADGYVVGVIKDYTESGSTPEWRDYANFITLFHPENGLYTQYVHLMHNGSFVEVGDRVKKGQPIGLSGMTGFTSGPHLHFNVLKPDEQGLISTPVEFEGRF